ncbi:tetratricopeptide repeat protein [Amaricoccus macauensis]|uniref:tetratricopeptide repeat protein n=1 Tax=Amaricoccus macauensis TaxID=57001 RepID=UPI003C7D8DF1
MKKFRKRFLVVLPSMLFGVVSAATVSAQPGEFAPDSEIERLHEQLAEPDRQDWERIERQIERIWSSSGSDSMDLLLERGREAMGAGDLETALQYLSALTDHAPDFAEGWNARATTFFMMQEYALSISDIEHVLSLNPRHFGALQGLGIMFEELGETELSLRAFRKAYELNPNQPEIDSAIERLERQKGAAEL